MKYLSLLIIAVIVIPVLGLVFSIISSPPSPPYFLRFQKSTYNKTFSPLQISQILLEHLNKRSVNEQHSGVFFHGNRLIKKIALTFDADMTRGMKSMLDNGSVISFYDSKLILSLRNMKVPATLFLTGMWVERYPDITKDLANDPLFELGGHSYSHRAYSSPCFNLENLPEVRKVEDFKVSQMLIEKYTHKKTTLFRFPGGCFGPKDLDLARSAGAKVIAWDVVANDGFNKNEEQIVRNVVTRVKNGSIIVMHMNGYPNEPVNYLAVPKIIETLRNQGYTFVKVSELLDFE